MTVETEVANLTTAVDNLTSAVNVSKATLDASVADAESAVTQAQSARDTAEDHKLAAEAAATSATNTAAALTGFDLEAIAASKGVTAVDVFVYDTSKDSDGGAWRKRTQATSWYNETLNTATRGSRREFPAVAVIVAEVNKVTIYDGDDPSLPMWMVFNAGVTGGEILISLGVVRSVSAKNGVLVFSTSDNGGHIIGFIEDLSKRAHNFLANTFASGIVARNGGGTYLTGGGFPIVNVDVNDVAMTVLPTAPIDPATGLPVPTIAVATSGGVSVIKDDGTVVDIYPISNPEHWRVEFVGEKLMMQGAYLDYSPWVVSIPDADVTGWAYQTFPTGITLEEYSTTGSNGPSGANLRFLGATGQRIKPMAAFGSTRYLCTASGLSLIAANEAVPSNGMVAYATSTYNTGWMNGDIKGAFLSDTDDTDLVGYTAIDDDGSSATGWSDARGNGTVTSTGGRIRSTATAAGAYGPVKTLTGLVVGKRYVCSADVLTGGGGGSFQFRITAVFDLNDTNTVNVGSSSDFSPSATFTATNSTMYVGVIHVAAAGGDYAEVDNISVKLADADRSVNNNGLIVNGTVTRTPVATGADLVAYSGFSASNYLEQPYNSDLDFGTGDFCVMGWAKGTSASDTILGRAFHNGSTYSGAGIVLDTDGSGNIRFRITDDGFATQDAAVGKAAQSAWAFYCGVVYSGTLFLYENGALTASTAVSNASGGVTNASATLRVGLLQGGINTHAGSLALLRISATAPTAEAIKKIYNDEKVLFQEGAQATLYGASNAVTALAHDPELNLLHVGTSAGRSVFQGLRRVSNTTTAVGTAISASGGMVVDE
jgi:hypothetical protein